MKRLLLVTILMVIAIITQSAFAQADSCNMTLLDEWECSIDDYIGFTSTGIEICNNHIIAALKNKLVILEIGSTGELTVIDSFCYILRTNYFTTSLLTAYLVRYDGHLDSLTTIEFGEEMMNLFIEDSILYGYDYNNMVSLYNISEPTSPFLIGSCELTALVGNPYAYYAQYPYIYVGGYESCGDDPEFMWEQGELLVMNVENIDSPFTVVNRLTEHGELYHPSIVKSISVKDSFIYAIGYEHIIEKYYLNYSTMNLNFSNSYYDSAYGGTFSLIENNKLFISSGDHFHIFDITSVDTTILTNYFNFEDAPITIHYFLFEDFCVKDSFVIALGTQLRADTAKISVLKFDPNVSSVNCSMNQKPSDYKLETYPNPFNSTCEISYTFVGKYPVNIGIYDIDGKLAAEFANMQPSGTVHWDGSENETGVYLVRASSGESVVSKKIVYIK